MKYEYMIMKDEDSGRYIFLFPTKDLFIPIMEV